jgi:hypothetical protein
MPLSACDRLEPDRPDAASPPDLADPADLAAPDLAPATCKADFDTDPDHCGTCDRVCGVACTHGVCDVYPYYVATDTNNVYWTEFGAGNVKRMPLTGGEPTVIASGLDRPAGITVDSNFVYWTVSRANTVMRAPLDGSSKPTVVASAQANPIPIVAVGGALYWGNYSPAPAGTIGMIPAGGGPPAVFQDGDDPSSLATDDISIYWTNAGAGRAVVKAVMGSLRSPDSQIVIADHQATPDAIAVDADFAYWGNIGDHTVNKAPTAGGGKVTVLAVDQATPIVLCLDSMNVYWTNYAAPGGGLGKVAKTGGGAVPVIASDHALGLACDPLGGLDWTIFTPAGAVRRIVP